jgi:hypothetical protein
MSRSTLERRLAGLMVPVMLVACQLSAAPATPTPAPTATLTPSATASATALPSATPSLTPTNTATPTETPTSTTTFTPSPTPTETPTPDPLADAVLKLADLPDGFIALSAADRTRLGFSDEVLAKGYAKAFSAAQLHNTTGFIYSNDPNFQIVLAYLFYPLSSVEQATIDLSLSDPAVFAKAFVTGAGTAAAAAGNNAKITAKPLVGMNKFGNKSVGVASIITTAEGAIVHLDIVVVRRGNVFEVYNSVYPDKSKPPAALLNLIKALDARVAAVVPN